MKKTTICGRCFEKKEKLYQAKCQGKPEKIVSALGTLVLCSDCHAVMEVEDQHTPVCKSCYDRQHPHLDKNPITILNGWEAPL